VEAHNNKHKQFIQNNTCTLTDKESKMVPEEMYEGGSKYVPVTKKDHEHQVRHNYMDHENEGIDTHTHTSRYIPAGATPFFGKKR
jgi:hypothetical protein